MYVLTRNLSAAAKKQLPLKCVLASNFLKFLQKNPGTFLWDLLFFEVLFYCNIDSFETHNPQYVVIITLCTVTVSTVYGFTLSKLQFYYKLSKPSKRLELKGWPFLYTHYALNTMKWFLSASKSERFYRSRKDLQYQYKHPYEHN